MFICAQGGAAGYALVGRYSRTSTDDAGMCRRPDGLGRGRCSVVGSAEKASKLPLAGNFRAGGRLNVRALGRSAAIYEEDDPEYCGKGFRASHDVGSTLLASNGCGYSKGFIAGTAINGGNSRILSGNRNLSDAGDGEYREKCRGKSYLLG